MDVFNRNHRGLNIFEHLYVIGVLCISMIYCLSGSYTASAQDEGKVAVLPFVVDAQETPDNLATGLQEIFASRISENGYQIISCDSVNKHPMAFQSPLEDSKLISLGRDLGAEWIVSGTLTKLDEKISLDIEVASTEPGKTPFTISMVEDSLDKLPDAAEKAAEGIDYHISGITFVSDIRVEGNERIESDAMLAQIDTQKGDRFDQEALDQDLRTIYRMGYFEDVQIETEDDVNGKIVTFKVTEKPYITSIAFEGNEEYKDDKLTEEIGIKQFAVLNMSDVKESINRLKEFYKKKGYYNATITEKIQNLPNNEAVLTYVIDEGEKVYITKIEFLGNEVYTDKELVKLMKTNKKGFFYWLTNSGVLEQDKLDYDVYQLTAFYQNHGYIEARLGGPEIAYEEGKGITITIPITEGNRYKVGDVNFDGDIIKPEEELLKEININKQEYYSREVLYNDIEVLKDIYADEGYAYAEISPMTKEDYETYDIDTTFIIDKKKKVRIERININGNTSTREKVIRRELKLVEGDYFSSSKIERSTNGLYRLTYLDNPEIKTREGSRDDLMILDVEVEEKYTGNFYAGVGYSSFDHLMASLGISMDNLFGRGQSISIDGSIGYRTTEYDLSFTEPWLFDKQVSGTINVYNLEVDYDDFTKDGRGGALGVAFLLGIDDYTSASVSYSYDDAYVTSIYSTYSPTIQDMMGKNVKSSVTTGVGRDSRDRIWSPSKGSVNSLSMEYAGGFLGGTSSFTKIRVVSTWYIPIWWNHVFLVKGSAGIVEQHGGGKLPTYEKFMLGGIDSVRGYDSYSISPKNTATGYSMGGERMWLGNIEYRIPIMEEQGVLGLFFFDVGNAFRKNADWRQGAKRSVGFGIRWLSPMGPLRLEYGIKLDREPGESAGEFEFTMSY